MINEEQKQLSEIYKISGFALMTPVGQIILSIPNLTLQDLNIKFFLYLILACLFFYFGMILLVKSLEEVTDLRSKKWTQY